MGLEEYNKKRDFSKTSEPEGKPGKARKVLRFVIQRHQATRLHYDLRLEMEGVLKSWAVPKGPSMNPSDKRLAILTEDHPIKYLNFEGTIPKGNYGAGDMVIWDRGTYTPKEGKGEETLLRQIEAGNLKIILSGKKLKGEFALVHTRAGEKENQWLLIKKKDDYSTDLDYDAENLTEKKSFEPVSDKIVIRLNEQIKPMLATKSSEIFDDPNWLYELKWDGYRALANINKGHVHLYSRNGISFNSKFASVVNSLKHIQHNTILDGEVVLLDEEGLPQFQLLQNYSPDEDNDLRFYVFDMLFLNGHNIMHLPLAERKSLIPEVIEDVPGVFYCDHIEGMGSAFYHRAIEAGMEGVIAKKKDSKYYPGSRSDNWLKIKSHESQEALICGFTDSRAGSAPFGSLILGMYEGEDLKYIGNCGSGFNDDLQREIFKILKPLITEKSPFAKKINLKGRKATWLQPEIICEVKFSEWTKSGSMRHPVFKGLRGDKAPPEIKREEVAAPRVKKMSDKGNDTLDIEGVSVPISNLEKIYWPDEGLRKYDLIDYYLKVSDIILPYLKDRPENLNRHPDGIKKEGFYQKDSGGILPHWIETARVFSKSNGREIEYMMCQNRASLLYMANLGCIELNPWNSRKGHLQKPDYTVIDIDPSPKNTFEEVIEVAQAAKEILDKAKINACCKTSGSSGLHIYIPLGAKYTYDQARDFTKVLCHFILDLIPEITSMERNIPKRKDKIYLDYLQNRKGQTLAAAYCLRPKKGATASAPLEWKEVKSGLDMQDFNIHTMEERIKEKGDLFHTVLENGIDMSAALDDLSDK